MQRALIALTVIALAITGSSACATKKFVNTRVGEVDGKKFEGLMDYTSLTFEIAGPKGEAPKSAATTESKAEAKTDAGPTEAVKTATT